MGVADLLPGVGSAREKAAETRERLEEVQAEAGEIAERQETAYERAVRATVEGDDEASREALAQFRDLRPERRVAEAAVERLEEKLAELRKPVLLEEHRDAVERSHSARARADTRADYLVEAVEALIDGPAAELAAAYRELREAAQEAGALERELAAGHDAVPEVETPTRVDRRFRRAVPDAWAALEALREWNGRRR